MENEKERDARLRVLSGLRVLFEQIVVRATMQEATLLGVGLGLLRRMQTNEFTPDMLRRLLETGGVE